MPHTHAHTPSNVQAKLTTLRRTVFDNVPNVLLINLKRFTLDFTTFETVKLNHRVTFPQRLDLLPFTKKGVEAAELAAAEVAKGESEMASLGESGDDENFGADGEKVKKDVPTGDPDEFMVRVTRGHLHFTMQNH